MIQGKNTVYRVGSNFNSGVDDKPNRVIGGCVICPEILISGYRILGPGASGRIQIQVRAVDAIPGTAPEWHAGYKIVRLNVVNRHHQFREVQIDVAPPHNK